jgi:hypothetical protein
MKKAVIKSTRLDGQDKRRDSQTVALLVNAQQTNSIGWALAGCSRGLIQAQRLTALTLRLMVR